jgi:proteic killer suppression protein
MLIILIIFVMGIYFENEKLLELAENQRKATKKLGKLQAQLFYSRLESLFISSSPSELMFLPGNFHLLKHGRLGQWACNLVHPSRLIFEIQKIDNLLESKNEVTDSYKVTIIEIIDYH